MIIEGSETLWNDFDVFDDGAVVHFNGCQAEYTMGLTQEPTCTEDGTITYSCLCDSYTESVPKLLHCYTFEYTIDKEATCSAEGSKSHHCIREGCTSRIDVTAIPKRSHSFGALKTSQKATLTENGKKVRICQGCGFEKAEYIYKISSIKLGETSYVYNGSARKPSVTVKDSKGNILKNGVDYSVTYYYSTDIGTAKVKVTFRGDYSGSKKLAYKIVLGATSKISDAQSLNSIKLSWKKVTGATGYRIYLFDSKGNLKQTKTTSKNTCTFTSLSAGAAYKAKVKAYVKRNGKTIWSPDVTALVTATKPVAASLTVKAGTNKAVLSWSKVKGAGGYEIYMASSLSGGFKKIKTLEGISNISMTKKGLTSGKKYYFKVRAYKLVNGEKIYGAYSPTVSVKIK